MERVFGWVYYLGRPDPTKGRNPAWPDKGYWCFSSNGRGPWQRHGELLIHDATFVIDAGLQADQRSRKKKQTHAFAYGEIVEPVRWPGIGSFVVEYNPWQDEHFHIGGKAIYRAELLKLSTLDDHGPLAEVLGPYWGATARGSIGQSM